jgi:hypothetical protein
VYNTPRQDSWYQTERIARAQKLLLWVILLTLVSFVPLLIPRGDELVALVRIVGAVTLIFAAFAARIYATYLLAKALGDSSEAILLWTLGTAFGGCIPLLGIVVLLVINQRATGRLQRAGLKVGLMGARLTSGPPRA